MHPVASTKSVYSSPTSTNYSISPQYSADERYVAIPGNSTSQYSIFIGCLPKRISRENLIQHFSQFGEILSLKIEKKMLPDNFSCQVNAYLRCGSKSMMKSILSTPQSIQGNKIKVAKHMSQEELRDYIERSKRCRVYIKRLPMDFNNEKLFSLFSKYGKINKAYCVQGTKIRKHFKYGYVLFENEASIERLPVSGVPSGSIKIQWTCYKLKLKKRIADEMLKRQISWQNQLKQSKFLTRQSRNYYKSDLPSQPPVYGHFQEVPPFQEQFGDSYLLNQISPHESIECSTLYSKDAEYYNYLHYKRLFEKVSLHASKPTTARYVKSAMPHLNHSKKNIRLNQNQKNHGLNSFRIKMNSITLTKKRLHKFTPYFGC